MTYKIIENAPYDTGAPESWWIVKTWRTWLGFRRTAVIGSGQFDNGGAMMEMPFFIAGL